MKKILLSVLMLMLSVQAVNADELSDSLNGYCEKMKQCAKAEMSAENMQGMPGGMMAMMAMMAMMEQSLNSMCANMMESYDKALKNNDLYEPALACYKSMGKQSCETLHDETPECERFGKLTEKYGN